MRRKRKERVKKIKTEMTGEKTDPEREREIEREREREREERRQIERSDKRRLIENRDRINDTVNNFD